jgi:hypothetical protein
MSAKLLVSFSLLLTSSMVMGQSSIELPIINEYGETLNLEAFSGKTKVKIANGKMFCHYLFKNEGAASEMFLFVDSPKEYSKLGHTLCYNGNAGEVVNILESLSDCVFSDQFLIHNFSVAGNVLKLSSTSDDDSSRFVTSYLRRCK